MSNSFNTKDWTEFLLQDIFLIDHGNKFDLNKMQLSTAHKIAFISRTGNNNGVSDWVEEYEETQPYPSGCITVALGGSIGSTFLQPQCFYTGQNVAVLIPKEELKEKMSQDVKLFLTYLIKKECNFRFVAYGRELNSHLGKDFTIRLPAIGDGVDWEQIAKLVNGTTQKLQLSTNGKTLALKNIQMWKPYLIRDLFDYDKKKNKMPRGKITSKDVLPEGDEYFYVGAKKKNNGVMYRCGYDEDKISKGNCIVFICNGQGSVGYTNYIDVDFYTSKDVALGYNENLNKYNALFLVAVLDKERFKYSFGRKWGNYLLDTEILLPATDEGTPDWDYMEEYIKSLPYGDNM